MWRRPPRTVRPSRDPTTSMPENFHREAGAVVAGLAVEANLQVTRIEVVEGHHRGGRSGRGPRGPRARPPSSPGLWGVPSPPGRSGRARDTEPRPSQSTLPPLDGDGGRGPDPRTHVLGGGAVVHVPVLRRRHLHHELDDLAVVPVKHPRERPRRRRLVAEVRAPGQRGPPRARPAATREALPDRLRPSPEGREVLLKGEALVLVADLPLDEGADRPGVHAGGRGAPSGGEQVGLLVEDARRPVALVRLHLGLGGTRPRSTLRPQAPRGSPWSAAHRPRWGPPGHRPSSRRTAGPERP